MKTLLAIVCYLPVLQSHFLSLNKKEKRDDLHSALSIGTYFILLLILGAAI